MEEVRANNVCREYKCTTEEPVFKFDRDPYDVVTNARVEFLTAHSPIIQPVTYCMNHYNERIIAALNSIRWKAER